MIARRLVIATTAFLVGAATIAWTQEPAEPGAPLTLDRLQAMALERHPTIAQARAEIDAARGRAQQAGTFPNPVVGYTGEEISGGPIIRGGEHGFFIEQMLPISGKLGLSRTVFEREVTHAEAVAEVQRIRVMTMVRSLFYEALVAARQVDAAERFAQVAQEAVGIARQLYNVGIADHPDVLEAEIQEQRAQIDLAAMQARRDREWLRLGVAVGEPALLPRPLAGTADRMPMIDRDQVLARLLTESPEIKAAHASLERAGAALKRAQREPTPDLYVRGGPRYNRELLETTAAGGVRPVGWEAAVEVGITLPLVDRNRGTVTASQAGRARAEAELRRVELRLRVRFAEVFERYLTARRTAEVYRDQIVPRAEQAHQMYLKRYRELSAAYPQVLAAQRTFVQAQRDYLDALVTTWRTAIQLEGFLLDDELASTGRPTDN
jgi:cobalt-zinc-cadmium efflux system outer membrane protein